MSSPQVAWDEPGTAPPQVKWDDEQNQNPVQNKEASFSTPLDEEIPLTSYGNATMSGLQSVGKAARGLGEAAMHPIDTVKSILHAPADTVRGAKQLPAALHDINQSSDPLGTYAKAAQETAAQGGVQALAAAATEGARIAAPKIGPAVRAAANSRAGQTAGIIAKAGVNATEKLPVVGGFVKAGKIAADVVPQVRKVWAKPPVFPGGILPEHPGTFPGANLPEDPGSFPGAPFPEKPAPELIKARVIGSGGSTPPPNPSEGLGKIPVREVAKPSNLAPVSRDATRQNIPYAGEAETAPKGEPQAKVQISKPSAQASPKVAPEAPQKPTATIAKPSARPTYETQGPRRYAGTVDDIREKPKVLADRLEDHGIQQEMNQDLEAHGQSAESEGRREYIARNSTGNTKGAMIAKANELRQQIRGTPPSDDLVEILEKSLEEAKKGKGIQTKK